MVSLLILSLTMCILDSNVDRTPLPLGHSLSMNTYLYVNPCSLFRIPDSLYFLTLTLKVFSDLEYFLTWGYFSPCSERWLTGTSDVPLNKDWGWDLSPTLKWSYLVLDLTFENSNLIFKIGQYCTTLRYNSLIVFQPGTGYSGVPMNDL